MPKMVNLHWIKPLVICGLKIVAFILHNGKLLNATRFFSVDQLSNTVICKIL